MRDARNCVDQYPSSPFDFAQVPCSPLKASRTALNCSELSWPTASCGWYWLVGQHWLVVLVQATLVGAVMPRLWPTTMARVCPRMSYIRSFRLPSIHLSRFASSDLCAPPYCWTGTRCNCASLLNNITRHVQPDIRIYSDICSAPYGVLSNRVMEPCLY